MAAQVADKYRDEYEAEMRAERDRRNAEFAGHLVVSASVALIVSLVVTWLAC